MATQSPFSFLQGALGPLVERLATNGPQPPEWFVQEVQHRLVLLLNHVLQQEPEAMQRLVRQQGRVARVAWRQFHLALRVTPAGLFDLAPEGSVPDLQFEVTESSPFAIAQAALAGEKPAIRIAGDVQFAAELNWLADNLRWDAEEDLARLVGDAPAHAACQAARRAADALRAFVARFGPARNAA